MNIFLFCLILISAKCVSSFINTFEKYKEFMKKLEEKDIILSKGLNWKLYEQKPLLSVVKEDKIVENHGNYVGTFIEVCSMY